MVDVVICTHNNRAIIGRVMNALARQTVTPVSCTVVDGLSTDGTAGFVRQQYPWALVLVKTDDSGPAASRNIGFANGSAEFVLFLDSDVELEPRWLEVQLLLMQNRPELAIVCGKLLQEGRPAILHSSYGAINRWGISWEGGLGEPSEAHNQLRRCLWVLSAAILVRRTVLERIGGFDADMFGTYEDTDLGWRATLCGYDVMFNPEAIATHFLNQTLNPRQPEMYKTLVRLLWRNRIRSMLINFGAVSLARYWTIHLACAVADAIVHGPRAAKLGALWWNLRNLPQTLERRHRVQRIRRVADKDLWPLFDRSFRRGPGYSLERYRKREVISGAIRLPPLRTTATSHDTSEAIP